ncbi:hypothetical protein P9D93_06940 [Bacillus mojavensis]|nr:hypothetical protein [Bacillus mojavensis]MEC1749613.1 hypothetical protein [Bacillus mojavensis]
MYWICGLRTEERIVAEGWIEWAAILEDMYQKQFEYVEWKRL